MRQVYGTKVSHLLLVFAKEAAAGRKLIVYHVENFAIDSGGNACQNDRLRAILHIGKRYAVRPAQMQKYAKCADPNPAMNRSVAGPVDNSRSDDHVRHFVALA